MMVKVAAIQLCTGIHREKNIADATTLIEAAAGEGATLIVTPEMTNVLDRRPRRLFETLPTAEALTERDHFEALSAQLGVTLAIGSMGVALINEGGTRKMANRSFVFAEGKTIAQYDKLHLFDVELPTGESWKESSTMVAGEEAVVAKTPAAALGLSICYDVRFPHLYRALAKAGAEILTVPAAFTVPTGEAHWEALLRARAIETGSFVIAAAQGGQHEDGRETYGHSMIVDPWGRVLAEKPDAVPGFILADLDLAQVADTRARIPALALERPVNTRIYSA